MRLNISSEATTDLGDIWDAVSEFDVDAADRLLRTLGAAMERLPSTRCWVGAAPSSVRVFGRGWLASILCSTSPVTMSSASFASFMGSVISTPSSDEANCADTVRTIYQTCTVVVPMQRDWRRSSSPVARCSPRFSGTEI